MDFFKVDDMQFVLVIMDKFSMYIVFVVMSNAYSVDVVVGLFHKHYVKHFGMPKDIVSDQDTQFTNKF